ncbi:hypothetical protein TNCV_2278081 [Trichonephila clavipes]|nr:hypothetical protein TNCV_2278081 [Trichonephila clavipes]
MSMEHFTNTELADMHLIYELAEGKARAAEILHRERYPQRDAPDHRMLQYRTHFIPFMEQNVLRRYRSKESEHHVESSSPQCPVLTMSITYAFPCLCPCLTIPIMWSGASLCGYLSRCNLSAACTFPFADP